MLRGGVGGSLRRGGGYAGVRFVFLAHATLLIGLIVAASYAGTSVLSAAFLACAMSMIRGGMGSAAVD